jgi:hypothetical protein
LYTGRVSARPILNFHLGHLSKYVVARERYVSKVQFLFKKTFVHTFETFVIC